jgi:putative lipoprotein
MKFALAFVLSGFPFGGPPREPPADHWFAADKAKHFLVSAVVQGVGHSVLRANGFAYRDAAWTAGLGTLSVGVGKELWDRHRGRVFSWRDLGADVAGGSMGAVVMRQVDR